MPFLFFHVKSAKFFRCRSHDLCHGVAYFSRKVHEGDHAKSAKFFRCRSHDLYHGVPFFSRKVRKVIQAQVSRPVPCRSFFFTQSPQSHSGAGLTTCATESFRRRSHDLCHGVPFFMQSPQKVASRGVFIGRLFGCLSCRGRGIAACFFLHRRFFKKHF